MEDTLFHDESHAQDNHDDGVCCEGDGHEGEGDKHGVIDCRGCLKEGDTSGLMEGIPPVHRPFDDGDGERACEGEDTAIDLSLLAMEEGVADGDMGEVEEEQDEH